MRDCNSVWFAFAYTMVIIHKNVIIAFGVLRSLISLFAILFCSETHDQFLFF